MKTKSSPSTIDLLNNGLADMTEARTRSTTKATTVAKKPVPKGGKEPSLVFEKPGPQKHTRAEAEEMIRDTRAIVAKMYAEGKFKSSAAMLVPLTDLDNATYYKSCGCFDRAVEICKNCKSKIA